MRWLSLAEVLELHRRLIEQSGGMPGLRDLGLLESSLAQPHQSFGGVDLYPGLIAKAAALGFSLIQNHPFVDGNKRVGAHAGIVFLVVNDVEPEFTSAELTEVIWSKPGICPSCRSKGAVTVAVITSGLAPGYKVLT